VVNFPLTFYKVAAPMLEVCCLFLGLWNNSSRCS